MTRLKIFPILFSVLVLALFLFIRDPSHTSENYKRISHFQTKTKTKVEREIKSQTIFSEVTNSAASTTENEFNSTTVNGTTWLGRVDFVSGYYACGAQVQVGSYGKYEYLTGIAFAICNGSDWYEQALSVVVEAVSENGTAGQWQTLVQCPVGSYVTGESVLLEKLGPAVAYIGLKLLCDDRNRTWISPYSNYTKDAGNWEQDIWSAMAIEAVEIGYYDVDTHVALNRIKNHLRPKNITMLYINYTLEEEDWNRTKFKIQENHIMNEGQGTMSLTETYSPFERTDELWKLDNDGVFTVSFSTKFMFPVPKLTKNGSEIVITNKLSMDFGKTLEKIESDRSFEVAYQLPNCTSGALIEYGAITDYKVPFKLDILYNYGEPVSITGVYSKYVFMKGNVKFKQVSNDSCT